MSDFRKIKIKVEKHSKGIDWILGMRYYWTGGYGGLYYNGFAVTEARAIAKATKRAEELKARLEPELLLLDAKLGATPNMPTYSSVVSQSSASKLVDSTTEEIAKQRFEKMMEQVKSLTGKLYTVDATLRADGGVTVQSDIRMLERLIETIYEAREK